MWAWLYPPPCRGCGQRPAWSSLDTARLAARVALAMVAAGGLVVAMAWAGTHHPEAAQVWAILAGAVMGARAVEGVR